LEVLAETRTCADEPALHTQSQYQHQRAQCWVTHVGHNRTEEVKETLPVTSHVCLWEFYADGKDADGKNDASEFECNLVNVMFVSVSPVSWVEDVGSLWTCVGTAAGTDMGRSVTLTSPSVHSQSAPTTTPNRNAIRASPMYICSNTASQRDRNGYCNGLATHALANEERQHAKDDGEAAEDGVRYMRRSHVHLIQLLMNVRELLEVQVRTGLNFPPWPPAICVGC